MDTNSSLLKSIRTMTEGVISSAPFDKTRKAQVLSIDSDSTCKIKMDGVEYPRVKVYGNAFGLTINQIVRVIIPENQPSQMFVLSPIANVNDLGKFGIGTITPYAGKIDGNWDKDFPPPNGWLLCDGSAVSRTTFDKLFEVIGTTYGAGDGSTTFNLPDLRGNTAFGVKSNDDDFTLGHSGGSKTHTPSGNVEGHALSVNEMPAHSHSNSNALKSSSNVSVNSTGRNFPSSGGEYHFVYKSSSEYSSASSITRSVTTDTAGQGYSHDHPFSGTEQNTMPPYLTLNYIICYKPIGGNGGGGGTGGSTSWGNIGGTLSEQTDLQNALDNKVDKASIVPNTCVEIYGTGSESITMSTKDTYYIPFTGGSWNYRGVSEDGRAGTQIAPSWAMLSDLNSTAKITIQSKGYYKVDYQLYFYDSFTVNDMVIACVLYNNSSSQSGAGLLRRSSGRAGTATPYTTIGGSCMVSCEVGDTLTLGGTNATGSRGTILKNNASRMIVTKMV